MLFGLSLWFRRRNPANDCTVGSIDVFDKTSPRVMMKISYIRSGSDINGGASLAANKINLLNMRPPHGLQRESFYFEMFGSSSPHSEQEGTRRKQEV